MDDQPGNDSASSPSPSGGPGRRPIAVQNHGEVATLAAPTVEPPTSTTPAPAAAAGPQPDAAPPTAPPAPGQVIGGGPASPSGPVVTSGGGKRWLKRLLALVSLVVLVAAGWFIYDHYVKKAPVEPVSQNKDIRLLKVGILNADFGELYPNMSASEYAYIVNGQIFEGLVRYENKSKIVPDLASNWTNPDDKTWVFTVRQGIKFHDGNTLEAADVKYSLDTVIASKSDFAQTFADTIAKVEVTSKNEVKITTTEPDPTLLNKLAFLYVIDDKLPTGQNASMAGSGPYQVRPGTTPTSTEVQLVAFDGYHGGKPSTRALTFGTRDDANDLIKAFQAGQFNIAGPVAPGAAQKVKGATEFVSVEPNIDFIGFNTVKPGPLQNKLVREAIRYAVDPEAVGKAREHRLTPLSQMIPEAVPGYNAAIKPYKQDIAKAKQLLAQAGYPNGLTLRLSTSDTAAANAALVDQLKQVGITVNVDEHKDFDEYIGYFDGGQAEMFTVDYTSDTLDGLDIYNTTLSSSNYSNPKLNSLLEQARGTVDQAKRLKLLQEAATIIDDDVAVVPLGSQDDIWLMDKPYVIKQDLPSSFISVYFYKVHNK